MFTFRLDTFLLSTAWYCISSAGITFTDFFLNISILSTILMQANTANFFFFRKFIFFIISHRSLKSFVTPMIAGLLESNQKIRWTFDKFFYSTNDIMNKITVKVFDCSTGINNKLYIDKTDRYVCHDAIHLF